MRRDPTELLRDHDIQPTIQRVAVAEAVLHTDTHPTADQVWARVREQHPLLSRATVYNTLNLFVEKGLLKSLVLAEGRVVFDPNVDRHHHFVDEETGAISDIPWDALQVRRIESLSGVEISTYQVVVHGRRKA